MNPLTRWLALAALLLAASIPESFARTQSKAYRTADGSNLRQIGQASIIYAQDHNDRFPEATDIWDYARLLAQDAGLEDARMWQSPIDPAFISLDSNATVLESAGTRPRALNPDFKKIKPSVAVVLGKLTAAMPATTPIAWTRGLQPDGTWAKHSPYGSDGGYLYFIGGNVAFFKNLGATAATGQLTRFDGQAPTNNILDALPPGTRIGEYIPTSEEQAAWSAAGRRYNEPLDRDYAALIGLLILWLPFVGFSVYRFINMRPNAFIILLWPLIITILCSIIIPTC